MPESREAFRVSRKVVSPFGRRMVALEIDFVSPCFDELPGMYV